MQLTRAADYAVRVMIYLAGLEAGARLRRDELAVAVDVPTHFLAKVLQSLVRARLVAAHRGSSGGFSLALPPAAISVLQVVEAVEGPIQLNFCVPGGPGCTRQGQCPGHWVWMEAQAALTHVLKNALISRLAAAPVQQSNVVYPWN